MIRTFEKFDKNSHYKIMIEKDDETLNIKILMHFDDDDTHSEYIMKEFDGWDITDIVDQLYLQGYKEL